VRLNQRDVKDTSTGQNETIRRFAEPAPLEQGSIGLCGGV